MFSKLAKQLAGAGTAGQASGPGSTHDFGDNSVMQERMQAEGEPDKAAKPPRTAQISNKMLDHNDDPMVTRIRATIRSYRDLGVKPRTKVTCGKVRGMVLRSFGTHAKVVFFDEIDERVVTIHHGETWGPEQEDALKKRRRKEAADQAREQDFEDEYESRRTQE